MVPGEIVDVIKGEYKGSQALIRGSASWYYHVQLLTDSGDNVPDGLLSLHRSVIAPREAAVDAVER